MLLYIKNILVVLNQSNNKKINNLEKINIKLDLEF